jgi:radical SAM protein with 4Fe4S-binding SPASM domain
MSVLCSTAPSESALVLDRLTHAANDRRVPLSGSVELTERCNLACVHCYLGSWRCSPARPEKEFATDRLLAGLDEAIEQGCLFLLFTGGDPLLRRDFATIYRHVRERGVMVTVFTNGTLVSDDHCSLFRELPPSMVEVTLYGADAATYEAITGVPGSFERCLAGVERLVAAGVRVGLKTVLLTVNHQELDAMRALAERYGAAFRFDAAVSACLDGDRAPLDLRLSAEKAVAIELADETRLRQWRKHYRRLKAVPGPTGLYGCGAGISSFFIDSRGVMFPCLMARSVSHDLEQSGFTSGWREVMPQIMDLEAGGMARCNTCSARGLCDACPGFVALETGKEDGWSDYLCAVGMARDKVIGRDTAAKGDPA